MKTKKSRKERKEIRFKRTVSGLDRSETGLKSYNTNNTFRQFPEWSNLLTEADQARAPTEASRAKTESAGTVSVSYNDMMV